MNHYTMLYRYGKYTREKNEIDKMKSTIYQLISSGRSCDNC